MTNGKQESGDGDVPGHARTDKRAAKKTTTAPTKKASRKDAARRAAEADVRENMGLAAGFDPAIDEDYVEKLLAEPPGALKDAMTIPEFCARVGFSVPTYNRRRDKGETPVERIVWGVPRIFEEDYATWKAKLERRGPDDDEGSAIDVKPPRKPPPLRPDDGRVRANRDPKRKPRPGDEYESMFKPLPRKPRRPRNGHRLTPQ